MNPTQYIYVTDDNPNGKFGQKLAERIFGRIKRIPDIQKICELGCGNGYFSGHLAGSGYKVVGVDASVSGIEYARKNYGESAQFFCSEISPALSDKLGSANFDLVVAIEAIEHFYCPADLIETARMLLRPNGYLLLTTPYHGYLKYLALSIINRMDAHLQPLFDGGHIKFFSVQTLSRLVSGGRGFSNVKFEFLGRVPWLWKNMICLARKK